MQTYQNLIEAKRILDKARYAVAAVEGDSPAWSTLYSAANYVNRQAAAAYSELRGEEAF